MTEYEKFLARIVQRREKMKNLPLIVYYRNYPSYVEVNFKLTSNHTSQHHFYLTDLFEQQFIDNHSK